MAITGKRFLMVCIVMTASLFCFDYSPQKQASKSKFAGFHPATGHAIYVPAPHVTALGEKPAQQVLQSSFAGGMTKPDRWQVGILLGLLLMLYDSAKPIRRKRPAWTGEAQ